MKKFNSFKLMLALCLAIMLMSVGIANASSSKPTIYVNNEKLDLYASVSYSGATLVPQREIFEKFGMDVSWDNTSKTVTATKGELTILLTANSRDAIVNETVVKLVQNPILDQDNVFFVPLRFVAEVLHATVIWDKKSDAEASVYINFPDESTSKATK
ncbi:copper amine oxidase N-terminal domain-containing protein [Paenibacillus sp. MMS18-CY102]|uniref:copper amine oxidase N-terminal domain-containing protein n=1 Tax=Paenibacillus sp. MMS18-CY102 TaxID=2682849 RepID=UPI001365DA77|nr:copper amine oxidase N-terminal domain-containing protein [Paenibacillus sp. MMS18-CY102]MWC29352.1 copper amine oxidase N-terminal domain-containing protein [Paenibacillus sp. MMS18-CY102]